MRAASVVVTSLVLFSGAAPSASGQDARPNISWGLLGGGSVPIGDSRSGLKGGRHVGVMAEALWPRDWRALRFEATYAVFRFPGGALRDSLDQPAGQLTGIVRLRAATANLILRPVARSAVSSYLIAGVGIFRVQTRFEPPRASGVSTHTSPPRTRFGLNAGLGFEMSRARVSVLAEARYHAVLHAPDQPELRMIPVSLGLCLR